jgi:inorganic pyrophosphatase
MYKNISSVRELPDLFRDQIQHFFEHYKDLEKGKWVKIKGWHGPKDSAKAIQASVEMYNNAKVKPAF